MRNAGRDSRSSASSLVASDGLHTNKGRAKRAVSRTILSDLRERSAIRSKLEDSSTSWTRETTRVERARRGMIHPRGSGDVAAS